MSHHARLAAQVAIWLSAAGIVWLLGRQWQEALAVFLTLLSFRLLSEIIATDREGE